MSEEQNQQQSNSNTLQDLFAQGAEAFGKIKDSVEDFVEKNITEENKEKLENLKKKAGEKSAEFEAKFKNTVDSFSEKINYVKKEDHDVLKDKVAELEAKIEALSKKA